MMEYLLYTMVSLLIICVIGVAFLLAFVAHWIWSEIIEEKALNKRPSKSCKYKRVSVLDDWSTECGKVFHDATESGNPVSDWAKYCPFCGGEIK